jgi:hypothetical protein
VKRLLATAAFALLLSTTVASATIDGLDPERFLCEAPTVTLGDARDPAPVYQTEIVYAPADHAWRVFHYRTNGETISRSEQYAMRDWSNYDNGVHAWTGTLNRSRNLQMIGELLYNERTQTMWYVERIFDHNLGKRMTMRMQTRCKAVALYSENDVPAAPPPVIAGPPTPRTYPEIRMVPGASYYLKPR